MATETVEPRSESSTTKREQLLKRWGRLKSDRSSWDDHWRDIDENLLPRSSRFFVQDRNRNDRRWNAIADNAGSMALDRLVGGLMSYGTSPARPWLRFRVGDKALNDSADVRIWLDTAAQRVLELFDKGNTYTVLPQLYEQLGAYGTAACLMLPDHEDVFRLYPMPIGEYALAVDYKGDVTSLYREFQKTASEIVKEFGAENCSEAVQGAVRRGDGDTPFVILHAIEPRAERDLTKQDDLNMEWRSIYFEEATEGGKILRESGFDHFPVLAPRWKVRPGDTYGESPGMRALGDIRQLQHEQEHKADVLNQITDPSLQTPTSLANRQVDRLPGGNNHYDQNTPHGGIRRAFEVQIDHTGLLEDIQDVRRRIDRAFYADLFVMLSTISDTTQRTAAEIAVRDEEKYSMLGPVSRQMSRELRGPLVSMALRHAMLAGQIPLPPPELQGMELDIEYLDVFSQAQKQIGTNATDRFLSVVMNLANVRPETLDKLDVDQVVDSYADSYGVDPKMVLASDDPRVQRVREARLKSQAAQEQAALAGQQSQTAKNLAAAELTPSNALGQFVGYGGAA